MSATGVDGFYAGYFSAAAGEGAALFVFREGVIIGIDLGAFKYDGTFEITPSGDIRVHAKVSIPAGQPSILGITGGVGGVDYTVDFILPVDFLEKPYVKINTPHGPANMRLVKLRSLT
jgi:hypothetical protein